MHLFVDVETVKRVAVPKLGVSEWGVVSQGRYRRVRRSMGPGGRARDPIGVADTLTCRR